MNIKTYSNEELPENWSELKNSEGNPAYSQCFGCGFTWKRGQSGDHACSVYLRKQVEELQKALSYTQAAVSGTFANGYTIRVTGHQFNAIQKALA